MKKINRRSILAGLSTFPFLARGTFAAGTQPRLMFAGTYTNHGSKGIYVYRLNDISGTLHPLGLAAETTNPSFLALSPDHRFLYAVNEISDFAGGHSGSVSAFSVNGNSGKLALKNAVRSGGAGPCNITVDHTGKSVFAANYGSGNVASFRVLSGGGVSEPVSDIQLTGHGQDPKRQEAPHTHCVTVAPGNHHLLVNDLGLNQILVYHLNPASAVLTPNSPPFYEALPGVGPRNLTFHPNGRWAYSLSEMGSSVDLLGWDSKAGTLTRLQNISSLPPDFHGSSTGATVAIDTTGRHLYASNRGADTIAVFAIDPANGKLKQVQQISCEGKTPRHFALDPSNRWLVVANQDSANLVILARDRESGHLRSTGRQVPLDSPACVAFA